MKYAFLGFLSNLSTRNLWLVGPGNLHLNESSPVIPVHMQVWELSAFPLFFSFHENSTFRVPGPLIVCTLNVLTNRNYICSFSVMANKYFL